MATTSAVWGIDVGNSSLKAMRCVPGEGGKIEALACDFIEHSKMLSQPGVVHADVLAETFATFASRNEIRRDKIAISVSGHHTIARFLRLPPVDPKKIPDMIRYEAKQWLPFAMDEVIWDFQPLGDPNAAADDDFFDAEVGMFAMKRDLAFRHLKPYLDASFDVDCVQSAPLALYNYAVFDLLRRAEHQYKLDAGNPPERIAILSIGTDSSDIIVTNGFSIWTRNIAIGGHSFTKALIKAVKLTHSKAEYLKRNANTAQDPKAVFQAMRPVFNEMLTEVQRSLEYYASLHKQAPISKIYAVGNAVKLPGLRQFLAQNLDLEVERVQSFQRLVGNEVLANPDFRGNISAFAVPYGLAIQMLGEAPLSTNLIPKEVVTDRIIRNKKPWALAAAAAIMLALTVQFLGATMALTRVESGAYGTAESRAKAVQDRSSKLKGETSTAKSAFSEIDTIGKNLTGSVEGRIIWCELYKAISEALPIERDRLDERTTEEVESQKRIFITSIDTLLIEDVAGWFSSIKEYELYIPDDDELKELGVAVAEIPLKEDVAGRLALLPALESAPGKIVQVSGYHFHNPKEVKGRQGVQMGAHYLRETFIKNLKYNRILLPPGMNQQLRAGGGQVAPEEVSMRELGIYYPTLLATPEVAETEMINPRVILEEFMKQQKLQLERNRPGGGRNSMMGSETGSSTMSGGMRPSGIGGTGGFGDGGSFGGGRGGAGGGMSLPNPFQQRGASGMLKRGSGSGGGTGAGTGSGGGMGAGGRGGGLSIDIDSIDEKDKLTLRRFDFVIQFAWIESPPSIREARRLEAELKAVSETAGDAAEGNAGALTGGGTRRETSLSITPVDVESLLSPTGNEPEPDLAEPDVMDETP